MSTFVPNRHNSCLQSPPLQIVSADHLFKDFVLDGLVISHRSQPPDTSSLSLALPDVVADPDRDVHTVATLKGRFRFHWLMLLSQF